MKTDILHMLRWRWRSRSVAYTPAPFLFQYRSSKPFILTTICIATFTVSFVVIKLPSLHPLLTGAPGCPPLQHCEHLKSDSHISVIFPHTVPGCACHPICSHFKMWRCPRRCSVLVLNSLSPLWRCSISRLSYVPSAPSISLKQLLNHPL
jgi:hypothetical protein